MNPQPAVPIPTNMKTILNLKPSGLFAFFGLVSILSFSGCVNPQSHTPKESQAEVPEKITLLEGDVVKITFPDSATFNTTTKIQRDGTIKLPVVGEIHVAGMTTGELEKFLVTKYADQIVSKEINVALESSTFQVYVTGAVMHPGKVVSDRPLTALEAVLEAGGVDYSQANLKGVVISRNIKGHLEHFKVNLQDVINGKSSETFHLRPNDILFVREKFSWF